MVLVHESWDLDLGVDLALGSMGQGFETLECDTSHWALGSGTWDWVQVLGAGTATLFGT